MQPFNQEESAMSSTAKDLNPDVGQQYSASIQDNPIRTKINNILTILNTLKGGL